MNFSPENLVNLAVLSKEDEGFIKLPGSLSKEDEDFVKLPGSNSQGGGSVTVNSCGSTESEDSDYGVKDDRSNGDMLIPKFEYTPVTLGATTTSLRIVGLEDFDESPEETTPPPKRLPNRKKAKSWNDIEEDALAKAWIDVSDEPDVGNQQRSESFWKRALVHFEAQLGNTDRTVHQLNSKWKDMNAKINKFNTVYKDKLANRGGDQSDVDILSETIVEYTKLYKTKAFPHHTTWKILKDNPKWNAAQRPPQAHAQSAKRTKTSDSYTYKTSSYAHFLNEQENEGPHHEDLQMPRLKGKKPTSSSASPEQQLLVKIVSEFNEFNKEDIEDKKRYRAEKLRIMKEEKEKKMLILEQELRMMQQKEKDKDMQFFLMPHYNLTGAALNAVIARKREITQRWGWE